MKGLDLIARALGRRRISARSRPRGSTSSIGMLTEDALAILPWFPGQTVLYKRITPP